MKRLIFSLLIAGGSITTAAFATQPVASDNALRAPVPSRGSAMPTAVPRSASVADARAGNDEAKPATNGYLAASATPAGCLTDTSQADFQSGTPTNIDLDSSPGDAVLFAPSAIDQQNTTVSVFGLGFSSTQWLAQTFTPGVTGALAQVDVDMFCSNCTGTTPDIMVSVQSVVSGRPSGTDLAAVTLPGLSNSSPTFLSAVFPVAPHLDVGLHYAVVVRSTADPSAGNYNVAMAYTDPYPAGASMESIDSGGSWAQLVTDMGFKTYMRATFDASGDLISSTKDGDPTLTGSPSWTTLSWDASTPANTSLVFQVAGSNSSSGPFNFIGPDGTAATYYTASGASLLQFSGYRYLQYHAWLATSDGSVTPILNDATVCYFDATPSDISISNDDGVASPPAGSSVVYAINVQNSGPGNATGVAVADAFPSGLSCTWTCDDAGGGTCAAAGTGDIDEAVDLPADSSVAFAATCMIPPDAPGSMSNTATATFAGDDNLSNNSATDVDTATLQADVVVTLSDSRRTVRLGDVVDYAIQVTNPGPSTVSANVSDVLPSQLSGGMWTCTPSGGAGCAAGTGDTLSDTATLPPGGTATYQFSAMVQSEGIDGIIVDMASADLTSGTDPTPGNNSATDTDAIVIFADGFE